MTAFAWGALGFIIGVCVGMLLMAALVTARDASREDRGREDITERRP